MLFLYTIVQTLVFPIFKIEKTSELQKKTSEIQIANVAKSD